MFGQRTAGPEGGVFPRPADASQNAGADRRRQAGTARRASGMRRFGRPWKKEGKRPVRREAAKSRAVSLPKRLPAGKRGGGRNLSEIGEMRGSMRKSPRSRSGPRTFLSDMERCDGRAADTRLRKPPEGLSARTSRRHARAAAGRPAERGSASASRGTHGGRSGACACGAYHGGPGCAASGRSGHGRSRSARTRTHGRGTCSAGLSRTNHGRPGTACSGLHHGRSGTAGSSRSDGGRSVPSGGQ